MTFTCDRCAGDYEVQAATATARVYVKDHRCNHIEARCGHCGATEIIYLGPHRLQTVLTAHPLPVIVVAEASADLRVRAEKAWAAAEERIERPAAAEPGRSGMVQEADAPAVVQEYQLTDRHEALLVSFGETLTNIPDDLLWDGITSDHSPDHPDRWVGE